MFLPENIPRGFKIYSTGEKPDLVRNTSSRGQYPGVFDYKYLDVPELNKICDFK